MKNFINRLFFKIQKENIKYAILHHAEKIYSIDDDIDFVVNVGKHRMLGLLKDFCKNNNAYIGNHYTIDIDIFRFDILYFENDTFRKIELDCACNSRKKDSLQLDAKELLENRKIVNVGGFNFYKVSDKNEIEYYIKKKAFKNNDINKYVEYLISLDNTISEKKISEKYKYWQNYFNSKSYKLKFYLNIGIRLTKRISENPAITISLLGPDGSGKSTIVREIYKIQFFINSYYFHLKPLKSSADNPIVVTDPHKFEPYSKVKSYLKLLYFIYQYNWGWLKNIMPLKIKSSLVIFDRYFDDLLVDNRRYRYGGSVAFAKLIRWFIPKPDLYFILTTDADIIYKRKQEVPFTELERQIKAYNNLADNKRYFKIDVSRTPKEIAKEVIKIIMNKMNERF